MTADHVRVLAKSYLKYMFIWCSPMLTLYLLLMKAGTLYIRGVTTIYARYKNYFLPDNMLYIPLTVARSSRQLED